MGGGFLCSFTLKLLIFSLLPFTATGPLVSVEAAQACSGWGLGGENDEDGRVTHVGSI